MKPMVGMKILVWGQFEAVLQTKLTATNTDDKTDEWYAEIPRQRVIVKLRRSKNNQLLVSGGKILAQHIEE